MSSIFQKLKANKSYSLIILLLIFWKPIIAQKKVSEKYADAYKKYLNATCPIKKDSIQHFVYFSRDREAIVDHPFLRHPMFKGAQIMYSWKDFEPQKGKYDFSILKQDLEYLEKFGKKIFIQLQDVTFNVKYKAVPDYLISDEYGGGATLQYNDEGKPEGWVAKRWNNNVRERFALLLQALGSEFDGKIEGINLQETAIGVNSKTDATFSEQGYLDGLKANMMALKKSFPKSTTMIYANFMPGEWLPWDDKGYLSSLYQYGEQIGVGLGGPDLMVTRKGQLNHALKFMHEGTYTVPIGIAVQDGNYFGKTGDEKDDKPRQNIVPLLHAFAKDFLKVDYMFWVNQEPYFKEDVLTCFSKEE
jgi:Beta-galactosidase